MSDIQDFIKTIIVFQSFFFAFYLFFQSKGKKISNIILACLLLLIGGQILGVFLSDRGVLSQILIANNKSFGFAYGPLFLLYTQSLIYENFQWKNQYFLHFVIYFTALILFQLWQNPSEVIFILFLMHILGYLTKAITEIYQYRKVLHQNYSQSQLINLKWLEWAIAIFCIILFSDMLQLLLGYVAGEFISQLFLLFTFLLLLFFVSMVVFKGLQHPQLFSGISDEQDNSPIKKYKYSVLEEDDIQEWKQKLFDFIQQEKPQHQEKLTLKDLALQLGLPTKNLSQVINQGFEQNFSDFINSFRIEEAKERFKNPKDEKETVLEVMYEVGFNSKSSFNAIFKQKTGLTPSQFKKKFQQK